MDNFKVIYKILKLLEVAMDYDGFDRNQLTAEYLGISKNRLDAILTMLQEEGYVHGVMYVRGLHGVKLDPSFGITLKGLEYLEENSTMKKAAALIKGIKDTIPGL